MRIWLLLALVLASQGALVARLWYEQVQRGPEHVQRIMHQSIRRERIAPVRGRIFSRDGVVLADNIPTHEVLFHLHEMKQPRRRGGPSTREFILATIEQTALVLGREHELDMVQVEARLRHHMRVYPALPFKAFDNLSQAEMARLYSLMPGFPGLEINTRMKRLYPLGDVGAHWLGYVGLRSSDQSPDGERYDYFLPELIGYKGLERLYDSHLSGEGGMRLMRVDNLGMYHDQLDQVRRPRMGDNLVLNIDSRAQKIGQSLLKGREGSLVLLDVRSGAVLAMVSEPSYDLPTMLAMVSDFSFDRKTVGDQFRALEEAPEKPLQNRAILAGYNCGSIIKPLIALSALEHEVITPDTIIDCPGYYQIGESRIRCSARWGHGEIDLHKAIEVSCNTYFIDIGLRTGIANLEETLASGGIGQPTGLELDSPYAKGILPGRDEKKRRQGIPWYTGDTALISIGQGFIGVSPLQAAVFTAAIANGGLLLRPRLVKAVQTVDANPVIVTRPDVRGQLAASPENLQMVREAMHSVIHGPNASAKSAQTEVIELAGKTGTAEVGSGDGRYKNVWFICFGPYTEPRYAVAVFIEHGESGGKTAAPIARQFFEHYLVAEE